MRVLECEAKTLLRLHGITVPPGEVVSSPTLAFEAASRISSPIALKAQIPIGNRMKAGGVRFAATPREAKVIATKMLGQRLSGFSVSRLLIEKKVANVAELYVAITYDERARCPVILFSRAGGTDVEKATEIHRRPFSTHGDHLQAAFTEIAKSLGLDISTLDTFSKLIKHLVFLFLEWDSLLLELNPILLTAEGEFVVADVHLELDDDAAGRQSDLLSQLPLSCYGQDIRSDFEKEASKIDSSDHRGVAGRVIPFDGDLGLLIGGGGASLTIMDAILDSGLRPANYCEIGGNPSVRKVAELTKLILRQPTVKKLAVVMNVVNNTRSDLIARGVIKGVIESGLVPHEVISVFRVPGSWEEESQELLGHYGVKGLGRETTFDGAIAEIQCPS